MSFFSAIFGKKEIEVAQSAGTAPPSATSSAQLIEEVKHTIELTEAELHDAEDQLAHAVEPNIKSSLEMLVARKTQAIADLHEKMASLQTK